MHVKVINSFKGNLQFEIESWLNSLQFEPILEKTELTSVSVDWVTLVIFYKSPS